MSTHRVAGRCRPWWAGFGCRGFRIFSYVICRLQWVGCLRFAHCVVRALRFAGRYRPVCAFNNTTTKAWPPTLRHDTQFLIQVGEMESGWGFDQRVEGFHITTVSCGVYALAGLDGADGGGLSVHSVRPLAIWCSRQKARPDPEAPPEAPGYMVF